MGRRLKKRRKTVDKIIVLVIMIVLAVASAVIYFGFRVVSIDYTGSKHYDKEQLNSYIFSNKTQNTLLYKLFGDKDKEIPFIQKYDVEIEWPNKLHVTVYEKAIVGYISYMGCNMYFDKDGIVVESSSQNYEGVPEISGLTFKSIVLHSKLDVGNTAVYNRILEMTQAFNKYNLNVDKVYFDSSYSVILYMNDIKVILGDADNCTDKLYALKQMSDKLVDMKGTLYLENYNGDSKSIIFKKEN
jgi:cell division protein FtsQ